MTTFPIRYAGWMALDLVRGSGLVTLMVVMFVVFLNFTVNGDAASGLPLATTVFVFVTTAGMVSRDFVSGYHRMLFVKPVSPPLYYLQRWLLGAVFVVLVVLLMDAGVALRSNVPMLGLPLLARTTLLYLLLGSLVFLASTVTRHDWLTAGLLMMGQSMLGKALEIGFWRGPVAKTIYAILPPFHLVGARTPLPAGMQLAHVVLYGVALVLAAVAVLHWRPLGSGKRD